MNLKELKIGKTGIITKVGGSGALRQHFLDMGVIPGAKVTLIKYAPMGDPMELLIHSYTLTLRLADAEKIEITECTETSTKEVEKPLEKAKIVVHPGLGEGGIYHDRKQRNREHEILFMDLRQWTENQVKNEQKKKVKLTIEQIEKASEIYHKWQKK